MAGVGVVGSQVREGFEPPSLSEVSFGLLGTGFREGRQMGERGSCGRKVGRGEGGFPG